jgi:HAD domain in Swiss Army Knife RNA repair proteins
MKIVFLDFDGVLNSRAFFRANKGKGATNELAEAGAIDPKAVARLNRIIADTGAQVVVSSSWRIGRTRFQLSEILRVRGFDGFVLGMTPDLTTVSDEGVCLAKERGDEIRAWLDDHWPDAAFVVLDDNADMTAVRNRFVQTSFDTGLTDEHVDRCIEILNRAVDGEAA